MSVVIIFEMLNLNDNSWFHLEQHLVVWTHELIQSKRRADIPNKILQHLAFVLWTAVRIRWKCSFTDATLDFGFTRCHAAGWTLTNKSRSYSKLSYVTLCSSVPTKVTLPLQSWNRWAETGPLILESKKLLILFSPSTVKWTSLSQSSPAKQLRPIRLIDCAGRFLLLR